MKVIAINGSPRKKWNTATLLTNPRKAAYNRVYNRTSVSVDRLFRAGKRGGCCLVIAGMVLAIILGTIYL